MSEFVFSCAHCGAKLSAEENEVGTEFECPVCQKTQVVPSPEKPGETVAGAPPPAPPRAPATTPVVHVPKRKIVLKTSPEALREEEEEDLDELIEEETGGSGLRVLAMAIGTAGVVLCGLSVAWVVMVQRLPDEADREWWQLMLSFVTTFLVSLMALVLAGMAFRVERIAARLRLLETAE